MNRIHCLITTGGMLNTEMCNKLYAVARDLIVSGEKLKRFRTKKMEGEVTTDLKYAGMGSIYGIECRAEFECDDSTRKMIVKYIMMKPFLPDATIEDGRWISLEDYMKELEEENASNPYFQRARNAHNN